MRKGLLTIGWLPSLGICFNLMVKESLPRLGGCSLLLQLTTKNIIISVRGVGVEGHRKIFLTKKKFKNNVFSEPRQLLGEAAVAFGPRWLGRTA